MFKWLFGKKCGKFYSHCIHYEGYETMANPKSDCKKPVTMLLYKCCRCPYFEYEYEESPFDL